MNAAIAIVNWNGGPDLLDCLASIQADEVVLVDNGSTDGSADAAMKRYPQTKRIDLPNNPGYGAAANAAGRATNGDPLVVVNPDVVLDATWLQTVTGAFESDPRLGVAGSKLLFPDGLVQHAGGIVRPPLMLADHRQYRQPDNSAESEPIDVDYVTGAALAIRRATFDQLGGFDEGFFLYYEETDFCRRARDGGWRVAYLPRARAVHRESSVTVRDSPEYYRQYHTGRIRYALKHVESAAFLGEIVPAERARLATVVAVEELAGLRQAFLANADALRSDALLGAKAPDLRPALTDALVQLAARAIATPPTSLHLPTAPRPRPPGLAGVWRRLRGSTRGSRAELAAAVERIEARLEQLEKRDDVQASWLVELDRDLAALRRGLGPGSG
jgi:GT2 family glycosyltransferase